MRETRCCTTACGNKYKACVDTTDSLVDGRDDNRSEAVAADVQIDVRRSAVRLVYRADIPPGDGLAGHPCVRSYAHLDVRHVGHSFAHPDLPGEAMKERQALAGLAKAIRRAVFPHDDPRYPARHAFHGVQRVALALEVPREHVELGERQREVARELLLAAVYYAVQTGEGWNVAHPGAEVADALFVVPAFSRPGYPYHYHYGPGPCGHRSHGQLVLPPSE